MNNYEQLEEILSKDYDYRHKWVIIYVNDEKSISLLQQFYKNEWRLQHAISDYKGGVYYTIEQV